MNTIEKNTIALLGAIRRIAQKQNQRKLSTPRGGPRIAASNWRPGVFLKAEV
jgi:hypothetical protein